MGIASGASELEKGHAATGLFDLGTAVVPEVISRAKTSKPTPNDFLLRLDPRNYEVDPNTVGSTGGNIVFKPKAPANRSPKINLLGKEVGERRLALGKRGGGTLASISAQTKAKNFFSIAWKVLGSNKEIQARIVHLMNQADKIYFDLTGLFGKDHPYWKNAREAAAAASESFSNWELNLIANNPALKSKTTFYYQGGKVDLGQVW